MVVCTILISAGVPGVNHSAAQPIKAVDSSCGYWLEGSWNCLTKTFKSVYTVLANIMLDCTPETLNEIELTMELWIENYTVTYKFDLFLQLERAFCSWKSLWKCRSAVAQHSPNPGWPCIFGQIKRNYCRLQSALAQSCPLSSKTCWIPFAFPPNFTSKTSLWSHDK